MPLERISSEQADDLLHAIRELTTTTRVISDPFKPRTIWREWGPTIVGCLMSAALVAVPAYLSLRDRVLILEQQSQDLSTLRDSITQQSGRIIKLESSEDNILRHLGELEHTMQEIARRVWGGASHSSLSTRAERG